MIKTIEILIKRCFVTVIALFFILAPQKATAQEDKNKVLDRIVAVVGNEIIMKSEIDAKLAMLKQQNPRIDVNNPEIRKKTLDAMIDENLVITKAIEDSIEVSEDEIDAEWKKFKDRLTTYYGSVKRIEDVYGMSMTRIQYEYRDIIKKQLLGKKIQQRKFSNVKISPREVKEFYEEMKDSLPKIPKQFELYHIVKYVGTDAKDKEELYEFAKKIRDSIVSGGNFSEFAKRYSQDPGTAQDGGELGWVEKGRLMPAFEKAAFDLAPGATSQPVETPFGYHIIQTQAKNKDSVLVRHILFRVGVSEEDREGTKEFLSNLKDSVENGADFEELAKKYSDEKETRGFGGKLGTMTENNIPANIKSQVMELPEGGVTDPTSYNADPSKPAFHILYKKRVIPEHQANLKEDYDFIKQKAKTFKQYELYEEWISQLRDEIYWEIKE